MDNEKYLNHFGIPGMKWGHRTAKSRIHGKSISKKPENSSDDHKKKISLKGKKLNQMTNAELRTFNERLQLEKQYKDLTKADVSPARKFMSDILSNSAKQLVTTQVTKYGTKGIDALLKQVAK